MNDHQLWLDSLQASDSLNYYQRHGLTLAQAAEQCSKWPFKYVNGQQTPESKALEALPPEKPLKGYALATTELRSTGETTQEALI